MVDVTILSKFKWTFENIIFTINTFNMNIKYSRSADIIEITTDIKAQYPELSKIISTMSGFIADQNSQETITQTTKESHSRLEKILNEYIYKHHLEMNHHAI